MAVFIVLNALAVAVVCFGTADAGLVDLHLTAPVMAKNSNFGTVNSDNSQTSVKHINQINENTINNNINTSNYVGSEKSAKLLEKLNENKHPLPSLPPAQPVPGMDDDAPQYGEEPAEETPPEEENTPQEDSPGEDEAQVEEVPQEEAPEEEIPTEEAPVQEAPIEEEPVEEAPVEEAPIEEEPVEGEPAQEPEENGSGDGDQSHSCSK